MKTNLMPSIIRMKVTALFSFKMAHFLNFTLDVHYFSRKRKHKNKFVKWKIIIQKQYRNVYQNRLIKNEKKKYYVTHEMRVNHEGKCSSGE